jgi:uncharacterized protein (TIGR00369 family)
MTAATELERWLADEREQLARYERGVRPGVASPARIAGLSGLQILRGSLAGDLPYPPIADTLDFLLLEVDEGRALFQGTPGQAHLNPMGTVHGGWYATLLDSALGCAVQTMLPAGRAYTTAELGINLVRAIGPRAQRVRAEGTIVHCGRQLATAQARLYGPDGTLYAHATTTCLVFDAAAQAAAREAAAQHARAPAP